MTENFASNLLCFLTTLFSDNVFFYYFFSALRAKSLKEGNKIDIEIFQCFVFILQKYHYAAVWCENSQRDKSLLIHDCNYDPQFLQQGSPDRWLYRQYT